MHRGIAAAAVAGTVLFLSGSAVGALAATAGPPWAWFDGDEQASVGRPQGTSDLELFAAGDLNALASHIRLGGRDGNFEFEHAANRDGSHLSAYVIGTSTRTPIIIGGDDQDVTSLVIGGRTGQKHDLQQWAPAGQVKAAIDGQGRLRLGNVRLAATIQRGKAVLLAYLPNGTRQVLATAAR